MLQIKRSLFIIVINTILVIAIFGYDSVFAATGRILIFPFAIHSEKDLGFMQNGIYEMLSTRLLLEGEVEVINHKNTLQALSDINYHSNRQKAFDAGKNLNADYLILGSLTVFGNSISTDARFYDIREEKPLVVFNKAGKSHGEVIEHIDLFTGLINEKVFGRKHVIDKPSVQKETPSDIHIHPEKILETPTNIIKKPSGIVQRAPESTFPDRWRSKNFKMPIKGLAIGDVDGDGKNETIFISHNTVFIYRYEKGRFVKTAEFKNNKYDSLLSVDVADINLNGKAEIFISNYSNGSKRLKSMVYELKGSKFLRIVDDSNWYYRVLYLPGRDNMLLGQKYHQTKLFDRDVYVLSSQNNEYLPEYSLKIPKRRHIFGLNIIDEQDEIFISFIKGRHIAIFSRSGDTKWTSGDKYGGSNNYIDYPSPSEQNEKERFYLPQRICLTDINKDGKNELIIVKNIDTTLGLFSRSKMYKSGYIECLGQDKYYELYEKWRTRKESGYISDYFIGDLTNDGKNDLVFAVVKKTGMAFTDAGSHIVCQQIGE